MQYVINRSPYASEHRVLSGNALKIIAAIAMTLDHIAVYLLPDHMVMLQLVFRIIGRLAFPLFAYFVAEGCRHSKHKLRRFLVILGAGIVFEVVYVIYGIIEQGGMEILTLFEGNFPEFMRFVQVTLLEGNIFLTLACSIFLIHIMQDCKKKLAEKNWTVAALMALAFVAAAVLVYGFNRVMYGLNYGYAGILLPLTVAFTDYEENKAPALFRKLDHPLVRLAFFALGLVVLTMRSSMKVVQTFGLLSLIPLALYNGKPGKAKLKWWFYAYYPAHLVILWIIGMLLK